jgi:hypothetical protein
MNWNNWILHKNIDSTLEKLHISREDYIDFLIKAKPPVSKNDKHPNGPYTPIWNHSLGAYDWHSNKADQERISQEIKETLGTFFLGVNNTIKKRGGREITPNQRKIYANLINAVNKDPERFFLTSNTKKIKRDDKETRKHVLRARHIVNLQKKFTNNYHKELLEESLSPKSRSLLDPSQINDRQNKLDSLNRYIKEGISEDYQVDFSHPDKVTIHHSPHGQVDPNDQDIYHVDGKPWISHTFTLNSFTDGENNHGEEMPKRKKSKLTESPSVPTTPDTIQTKLPKVP